MWLVSNLDVLQLAIVTSLALQTCQLLSSFQQVHIHIMHVDVHAHIQYNIHTYCTHTCTCTMGAYVWTKECQIKFLLQTVHLESFCHGNVLLPTLKGTCVECLLVFPSVVSGQSNVPCTERATNTTGLVNTHVQVYTCTCACTLHTTHICIGPCENDV